MSNKNNITESIDAQEKKKLDHTRLFLLIFAAVALVGIIVSIVIVLIPSDKKNGGLDYLKDNLSRYVYVPEELYNDYKVTVELEKPGDKEIEYEIIKLLCTNKSKHVDADGKEIPVINRPSGVTVTAGDVVNIYYRGYTLGEDGSKNYFDGGCNFTDSTYALEIGSGSFIPGFEYNLIGKKNNDYATMEKVTTGSTKAGDIISLTYSVHYADGKTSLTKTAMIDLSDPGVAKTWGVGFAEYFTEGEGKAIGSSITGGSGSDGKLIVPTTTSAGGDDIYFDMTVNQVFRISDAERLVVEAYFPYNYGEESLNGKTAYFEVYIKSVQDYAVKEFNDAFITDVLKKTADDLASYSGETLTEKYRALIKSDLDKKYDEDVKSVVESQLWKNLVEKSTFHKLPESEVTEAYDGYLAEINSTYAGGYSSYYSSLDEFARAYLNIDATADWKAKLRSDAEYSIKQKLAFYYIIRTEDLIPNDKEYQELYDELFGEYLQSYLDYYGYKETDENYAAKVEAGKKEILAQYGEAYWKESVIYEFAIDEILSRADITYAH